MEAHYIETYNYELFKSFKTKSEAELFINKNGGILIHACNTGGSGCETDKEWQVWPSQIKDKSVETVSYSE